jgi:RNA ligase
MVLDGHVVCKTKKSFETIQALRANEFINAHPNYHAFVMYCASTDCTPTFEWTSPSDRIVLKYETDELVLTHIRHNITGEYILDLGSRASFFKIPVVEDLTPFGPFSIDNMLKKLQTEEQKEGYVIQFEDGNMVKLKTPWYINLHHSVTFTRERDIAQMVIEESVDDFKSYLTGIGESLDKVEAIEKRVNDTINQLATRVKGYVTTNYTTDRKEFAMKAKSHELFGLIMSEYTGAEPKYKEYFIKNFLKDYSLETV